MYQGWPRRGSRFDASLSFETKGQGRGGAVSNLLRFVRAFKLRTTSLFQCFTMTKRFIAIAHVPQLLVLPSALVDGTPAIPAALRQLVPGTLPQLYPSAVSGSFFQQLSESTQDETPRAATGRLSAPRQSAPAPHAGFRTRSAPQEGTALGLGSWSTEGSAITEPPTPRQARPGPPASQPQGSVPLRAPPPFQQKEEGKKLPQITERTLTKDLK